jgi:hypothetical protein
MVEEQRDRAPAEDAIIDAEEAQQLQSLAAMGWGAKRIAKQMWRRDKQRVARPTQLRFGARS